MSEKYILVKIEGERRIMAPCQEGGEVTAVDDQKNAICVCQRGYCWVGPDNRVIPENWDKNWMFWPISG